MYDPREDMAALLGMRPQPNPQMQAMFGIPQPQLQKMAGDVVPLPMSPATSQTDRAYNLGPTGDSANYAVGRMQDPKVAPVNPVVLEQWYRNMALRR